MTATRVHRSGFWHYLVSLGGRYPYRCEQCKIRFFAYRGYRRSQLQWRRWTECPNCSFTGVERVSKDRVPPNWANAWCRVISLPAYRCPECRTKFFAVRKPKKAIDKKSASQRVA